jgi:sigma-B regulation protein RsbU (phosphoserine phosphatase)
VYKARHSLVATGVRSAMCTPLWLAPKMGMTEEVIGLIYADTRNAMRAFERDDLEILTALSNIAASKIEGTRLLEANFEKERLEGEMRMAAEIQKSILPKGAPFVPDCELDGESRSCEAVGGDYHDFLWDGRQLSLAVADASGKGLGAAMLMTSLRTAVHAHWHDTSLVRVVARINRTFYENVPGDKFATCFLSRFDPQTGRLVYVSAGHPPAILVRANGTCESLNEGGPGLGLFEAADFEEGVKILSPGDTLVAYSDGVSEAWPTQEEAEEHLVNLVRTYAAVPVAVLRHQILAGVDRRHGGVRRDDCTVVVLRWSPAQVRFAAGT